LRLRLQQHREYRQVVLPRQQQLAVQQLAVRFGDGGGGGGFGSNLPKPPSSERQRHRQGNDNYNNDSNSDNNNPDYGGLRVLRSENDKGGVEFRRRISYKDEDDVNFRKRNQLHELDALVTTDDVSDVPPLDRFERYDDLEYYPRKWKRGGERDDEGEDLSSGSNWCRRPKWSDARQYPSCNAFHELDLADAVGGVGGVGGDVRTTTTTSQYDTTYLGDGHFRNVWMVSFPTKTKRRTGAADDRNGNGTDADTDHNDDDNDPQQQQQQHHTCEAVLKMNRWYENRRFKPYDYDQTRMEALALLETHASSRTASLYGYCATSVFVEPGQPVEQYVLPEPGWYKQEWLEEEYREQQRQLQREQEDGKVEDITVVAASLSKNQYTPEEKLELALAAAESVADLHGNADGPIVHHDLSWGQWLISRKDGRLKLNDLNKARVLYWNEAEQRYCKFWSNQYDVYRVPEEIGDGGLIDESSDVGAFGKLLYTLLTGLLPYYDTIADNNDGDDSRAIKMIVQGKYPYVDERYRTRSFVESRLVDIMERCWDYDADKRPSIFDVVRHLRETATTHHNNSTVTTGSVNSNVVGRGEAGDGADDEDDNQLPRSW